KGLLIRHKHLFFICLLWPCLIQPMSLTALARDGEKRARMKDLPPAVRKTVQGQSHGANLRGLAREIEKGKTFYEVEMLVNGHTKDVLMDAAAQKSNNGLRCRTGCLSGGSPLATDRMSCQRIAAGAPAARSAPTWAETRAIRSPTVSAGSSFRSRARPAAASSRA
ncbi:MAG: hypothetical protein ACKV2V_20375, partial [Blastocatellia bacterium]